MLEFTFKGEKSSQYGVYLRDMPNIPSAEKDMDVIDVPGRSAPLVMDRGNYKAQQIEIEAYVTDATKLNAARGWLTGTGNMIFSGSSGVAYKVMIAGKVEDEKVGRTVKSRTLQIPCTFFPFRYVYPAPAAQEITTSGGTITNPGTVFSQPEIKLTGSGDITLVVNGYSIEARSLTDGAIIDCELMETFNLAKTASLNSSFVMDEFPVLRPGANIITWTGSVTKVEITPRWRYL